MKNTTDKRLLTLAAVRDKTTLSKTEIYRRIDSGSFPEPHKIGERKVAWLECEVNLWITNITRGQKTL